MASSAGMGSWRCHDEVWLEERTFPVDREEEKSEDKRRTKDNEKSSKFP